MRPLAEADIRAYLDLAGEDALGSVGAYRIEGLGRLLFERVEGEQATIIGLPMGPLLAYFRAAGLTRL
jgi:septum formation protein